MTTMTELIPNVISYLVAEAPTWVPSGTVILDGPPPTGDQLELDPDGITQRLWVGTEGIGRPGQPADSGSSHQGFSFLDHARTRDDQIEIICAAECCSGDAVMGNARGTGGQAGGGAFAVMAGVEVMLRGDVAFGPGDCTMGGLVQWSEVTGPVELQQEQQTTGAWVLVKFRVSAFVRLTS